MFRYLFLAVLSIGLLLSGCSSSWIMENVNRAWEIDVRKDTRPNRTADINGTVKSIIGNEFIIETLELWDELGFQFDRENIQAMTDSQRQEVMQKIQDANDNAKKVNVRVIIPFDIPIFMRTAARWWWLLGSQARFRGIWNTIGSWVWSNYRWVKDLIKQWSIDDIQEESIVQIWLLTGSNNRMIAEWVFISKLIN